MMLGRMDIAYALIELGIVNVVFKDMLIHTFSVFIVVMHGFMYNLNRDV